MRTFWLLLMPILFGCGPSVPAPTETMLPPGSLIIFRSGVQVICDLGIWTTTRFPYEQTVRCYQHDGYMDINRIDIGTIKVRQ